MAGINYDLTLADRKTTKWLAASSEADEALLEKASKDGGWVRVNGEKFLNVNRCIWVKVSSVTPVKRK